MKFTSYLLIVLSIAFFSLVGTSCSLLEPRCERECNSGEPDDDCICVCPAGYESFNCSVLSREKIMGSGSGSVSCGGGNGFPYTDAIVAPDATNDLKFNIDFSIDIYNYSWTLTMTGENSFDLPLQPACGVCVEIQGSGTITADGQFVVNTNDSVSGDCSWTFNVN